MDASASGRRQIVDSPSPESTVLVQSTEADLAPPKPSREDDLPLGPEGSTCRDQLGASVIFSGWVSDPSKFILQHSVFFVPN